MGLAFGGFLVTGTVGVWSFSSGSVRNIEKIKQR